MLSKRVIHLVKIQFIHEAIASQGTLNLSDIVEEGKAYPVRLDIIEWRSATNRALYLCNEKGFPLTQVERRFHIGAFAAAVRANLPLLPVAIRGTRHCLAPGSPWPRPGVIRIEALAALAPLASGGEQDASERDNRERAVRLRDAARRALLAALGEPDLDKSAQR